MNSRRPTQPPETAQQPSRGCGSMVLGLLLVLAGLPMLVCPGPGMATIAAGLALLGIGSRRRGRPAP